MNVRFARLTTTALGAVCGVLLVAALLQYAGVGRGCTCGGPKLGLSPTWREMHIVWLPFPAFVSNRMPSHASAEE